MELKTYIWIGVIAGGLIGGVLGGMLDHGNMFGLWGILISSIGSIVGIFVGYKLYSNS